MKAVVPMEPEAPALFSTMTLWPKRSESFWAIRRAAVSVGPPAGKATTMRTTLSGHAEANALNGLKTVVNEPAAHACRSWRREVRIPVMLTNQSSNVTN